MDFRLRPGVDDRRSHLLRDQIRDGAAKLRRKYPLLSNYEAYISRVDLNERGVWYRLRFGTLGNRFDSMAGYRRLQFVQFRLRKLRTVYTAASWCCPQPGPF